MAAFMMLEYAERRNLRRNRIFRDRIHPLDKYDDVDLYRKFRFRRQDIMDLTDEVADDLLLTNRRGTLLPSLQVCLALRFYACGTFQDVCAELIGVSQPTASRTITRVTNAFLRHCPEWIRMPTLEEARRTKDKIFRQHNLPNVFGFIDCTHVRIQAPTANEYEYVNRKHYHSINVQVICDADMTFINVIAKWPGSVHDARILRQSSLFDDFEGNDKPIDGFILGDGGYMLRDWLLTPHQNPLTRPERNFNFVHSSARCTIERTIGVAKKRWHCLRWLRVTPIKACRIITVCLMLHNRARVLNLDDPDSDDEDEDDDDEQDNEEPEPAANVDNMTERARAAAGKIVRNRIANNYC